MSDVTYYLKTGEEIEAEQVAIVEGLTGETLYESDERRAMLKAQTYGFAMLGRYIDNKAKNNFLRTCTEETINDFGDFKNLDRTVASKALTTLKFTRLGNLFSEQAVSYGTKVSAGDIIFQTKKTVNFAQGSTECTVEAECIEEGSFANGLLPGQINTIIDTDPYLVGVTNITTTNSGSDYEDIEIYRSKIRVAPEGYSCAGPEEAYVFFAKTADPSISDIWIDSPTPCVIDIYVLMKKGELPSEELLTKVKDICSAKNIRPLGDLVTAKAPTKVNFEVELSYKLPKEMETLAGIKRAEVDTTIQEFIDSIRNKLGKDIDPDDLKGKLLNLGLKRVVITSPVLTVLEKTKVGVGTVKSVLYAGVLDD